MLPQTHRQMPKNKKDNTLLGVAVIIATVFTMAFTDAVIKFLSAEFPLWQIFVVRSLLAIALLTALIFARNGWRVLSFKWSVLRGFLLAFMYVAIYAAAPVLPLATIAAALYTGPIFVALLSAFWLGEKLNARRWFAVALGFGGVLAVLQPGGDGFSFYMLIPVLAGFLYALAAVVTRAKCRDENPQTLALLLNFCILIVGLIATIVLAVLSPTSLAATYPFLFGEWLAMGAHEWRLMLLLAVLIVAIGIGLALAYQSAPPAIIATFDYSYLLFAALWGFIFFNALPTPSAIAGMTLIVIAGWLVLDRH